MSVQITDEIIEARDRERARLVVQISLRKAWLNGFASGMIAALGIYLAMVRLVGVS